MKGRSLKIKIDADHDPTSRLIAIAQRSVSNFLLRYGMSTRRLREEFHLHTVFREIRWITDGAFVPGKTYYVESNLELTERGFLFRRTYSLQDDSRKKVILTQMMVVLVVDDCGRSKPLPEVLRERLT